MARLVKEIDWAVVEKRMEAGETAACICYRHGLCVETFYKHFRKKYGCGFGDYQNKMKQVGKSNIIFTQYMKALSGNVKMLELLGREWCGQGKHEQNQSPFEDIIALRHENMILKSQLEKLQQDVYADKPQAESELRGSESPL